MVSVADDRLLRVATWDDGSGPIEVELSEVQVEGFLKDIARTREINGKPVTQATIDLIRAQIRMLQEYPELISVPLRTPY